MNKDHAVAMALLRLCFADKPRNEDLQLIDQGIKADTLYNGHFRMLPLLYKRINMQLFSAESQVKFESIYKHTYYRNRILIDRAAKAQTYLAKYIEPPFVLLKGLGLALSVYEGIGERPMDDIDIFVPSYPLDGGTATSGLQENESWTLRGDPLQTIGFYDAQDFKYDFHRKINGLATSNAVAKLCLANRQMITYRNYSFEMLSFEHQFVHVIVHGIISRDVMYSRRWMFDALVLLREKSLDAEKIAEFANLWDMPSLFSMGLARLLELPEEINFDRELLNKIQTNIKKKARFYTWLVMSDYELDTLDRKPFSRAAWLRAVVSCFVVRPIKWHQWLSYSEFYRHTLKIEPGKSVLVAIIRRVISRLNCLFGKWVPRER